MDHFLYQKKAGHEYYITNTTPNDTTFNRPPHSGLNFISPLNQDLRSSTPRKTSNEATIFDNKVSSKKAVDACRWLFQELSGTGIL